MTDDDDHQLKLCEPRDSYGESSITLMTFGIQYTVKIQSRVLSFIIHTRIHYDPSEHVSSLGFVREENTCFITYLCSRRIFIKISGRHFSCLFILNAI